MHLSKLLKNISLNVKKIKCFTNVHVSIMFQSKRLVESQNSDRKLVLMGACPPVSLLALCFLSVLAWFS